MTVPHPIPYQGSKRNLASVILSCFPGDMERLIEPFAGSGAVSLAAAYYRKAKYFVLNDINAPLLSLWAAIIEKPEIMAAQYRRVWEEQSGREREYYDVVRHEFNRTHRPDYFLYLLARCVKASVRYNPSGEFNQSPDNRRRGAHPKVMAERIIGASRLLQGKTTLMCGDYCDVLRLARPGDIVYMDPTYQGVCGARDPRYMGHPSNESFAEALSDLNDKGTYYIVSYDGRTGTKTYGKPLPASLGLTHIFVEAGRSSQATLLGRKDRTYESLYLSPALAKRLCKLPEHLTSASPRQGVFAELS